MAAERLAYLATAAVVWATSVSAAACCAAVGAPDGTGAMTMPLPIVVVPLTLGQTEAVVEAGLAAVPGLVEPDAGLVPPDMPDMPDTPLELPVDEVLAPCEGAAAAPDPAASVSDVAPRTSRAATPSEDAAPHHIRPPCPWRSIGSALSRRRSA